MSGLQTGALASLGVLLGAGAGYFIHAEIADPVAIIVERPEIIQQQLTTDELAELCSENVKPEREKLMDAQATVEGLQTELQARETELAAYKLQAEEDEARKEGAIRRWRAMEAEIEQLKADLSIAETERDDLMVELKDTIYKLEVQIQETRVAKAEARFYKNEATVNLWAAFSADAKVEICDRGTRKRHEKCHEAVNATIRSYRERFVECVESWQAVPMLVQGDKRRREELAPYAEWLDEDDRFTKKGWYVQFCDPTLPEAGESTASPVPVDVGGG